MSEKQVTEIIKSSKQGTTVMRCHCDSVFQDRHYGPSMRLHNVMGTTSKGKARCTVCGDVKQ